MLDLGGGSGDYAMAFVRAKEDLRATVFDRPEVIPLTQEYIKQERLADRIDTVAGDFHKDDLGAGYDLVFMSAITHIYSERQNKALFKKAFNALNLGGRLIIKDVIMDEDRTSPMSGALFALNMLVATDSGDTYTESEIGKWMEASGFCDILRKNTVSGTTIMIGRKPAQ
jgi:ubiquinone/menaquinone biosynthesis C-methylase UbiE